MYLSRVFNSCCLLLETKCHCSLFLHWSGSKFLIVMAVCTPSIHIFLGRPLYLLSCGIQSGIQSVINFGILSYGILLTWPYHCSLFFSVMSMMSGFPFTPIITLITLACQKKNEHTFWMILWPLSIALTGTVYLLWQQGNVRNVDQV